MSKHSSYQAQLLAAAILLFFLITGCGTQRQARRLQERMTNISLNLSKQQDFMPDVSKDSIVKRDTFSVQDGEKTITIMRAVQDEDGEMVAHDVLNAAVVTARFRNVAERHGKVDIEFRLTIPEEMRNNKWQLRFQPKMYIMEDTVMLDKVIVTGSDYRKAQLRGYEQYNKFLSSIIMDSTKFVNYRLLEIFIQRNIPALWAFRTDTTYVSDEQFSSAFGVTEKEAINHYTNKFSKGLNERRKAKREKMYNKFVKVPIVKEGIRLDTVLYDPHGDFFYDYVETIETKPKLRKVDVVIAGEVYEDEKLIYTMPDTPPLTFYISSISAFVDNTEKYLKKVIERRVAANTACYVEFALGKSIVDETLGNNAEEMGRIRGNLADLMEDTVFDLDSIVVTAAASPEGSRKLNENLSLKRSQSISDYYKKWMHHYADSLDAEKGFSVGLDGKVVKSEKTSTIEFIGRSIGENWDMLDNLVKRDSSLTEKQRKDYFRHSDIKDPDAREAAFKGADYYQYFREALYPRLRAVRFDFHLHRKGMVKDTVHTTVLDSVYMSGVQAIRDRDYKVALNILKAYNDYNTAIAYVSLDYNASAMKILEKLEKTARVNYMMAILYSRKGDDRKAVEYYVRSCSQDPTFVHRGNLDPEISVLIKRYGLNLQPEDEFDYAI